MNTHPAGEHRAAGPRSVACAVITLSDTRGPEDDRSGAAIRSMLESAGHFVAFYRVVKDEPELLRGAMAGAAESGAAAILLNGGTGIAPRDQTPDALAAMYERELPGFGEIFRALSFAEIGAAAMLSRASAGVWRGRIVFSMPGSTGAVRLAMERLILPELGHAAGLLGPVASAAEGNPDR